MNKWRIVIIVFGVLLAVIAFSNMIFWLLLAADSLVSDKKLAIWEIVSLPFLITGISIVYKIGIRKTEFKARLNTVFVCAVAAGLLLAIIGYTAPLSWRFDFIFIIGGPALFICSLILFIINLVKT